MKIIAADSQIIKFAHFLFRGGDALTLYNITHFISIEK